LPCGLRNQLVDVPARESPNVDVAKYVEEIVGAEITRVHRMLSPLCTAQQLTFLALPIGNLNDPSAWLGKQTDMVPPEFDDHGNIK
jgi:hypothetical protein